MRKTLLFILLLPITLHSQNLVRNPSFEKTQNCAEKVSLFDQQVLNWTTPTSGTTDLFNACSMGETGIPENFSGFQAANFGSNYAGCYLFAEDEYREYVQGNLKSPLIRGKTYRVSLYISLGDYANTAVNIVDFLLTEKEFDVSIETGLSGQILQDLTPGYPVYSVIGEGFYNNKQDWTYISMDIVALGGEQFITIGNFKNNSETKYDSVISNGAPQTAYYYIDMVAVEEIGIDKITESKKTKFTFNNIHFEFDSYSLTEAAKVELNRVAQFLETQTDSNLVISGHTDATGTESYNNILAEKRAKEVASYLVNTGIDAGRLQIKSHGKLSPLFPNSSEKGRQENRRVEISEI